MKLLSKRSRKSRGSVLMLSIFLLIALFITASAFLNLIPLESRAAQRSERIAMSSLACDSGVTESLSWLRNQLAPPDGTPSREPMAASVYPSEASRTRNVGGGWAYQWRLEADNETFPYGSNPIRGYTIIVRSYFNGKVQREARAQVIQDSLSKYAALYNMWPEDLVQGVRSTTVPAGGPVHTNGTMRLWIQEGAAFWGSAGKPPYSHGLTAHGTLAGSQDGFGYFQGNYNGTDATKVPYNAGGPIASRYNRMSADGREGMKAGADKIPLPTNTFSLRDAAWGFNASTAVPTTAGVYLNETGGSVNGVYIKGDVEEMELGFGGSQPAGTGTINYGGNSWVKLELPITGQRRIDYNENYTVVTIKESPVTLPVGSIVNGTALTSPRTYDKINAGGGAYTYPTLMRRPNGTFEYKATQLNGVVYADGNINDVWGTNKGRRTIGVSSDTATNTKHNIYIGGKEADTSTTAAGAFSIAAGQKGILQFGATDANNDGILDAPATADHVLGMVADNVIISSKIKHNTNWATSHPANNPLYLYITVLGGITDASGSYKVDAYDSGGAGWAYKYGSRIMNAGGAWGTTSGHGLVNGNTFFDEAASLAPPPYFPAIPTFALKSYEERFIDDGDTL